jgi:hypothetical protein
VALERGFALRILFEGLKRISGLRVVRKERFKEQQKKWRKKQRARFKQKTAELRSSYYLSGAHKKVDIRELGGFGAIASQVIADRMTKMNYDRLYTLWQAARMSPDHMPIVEVGVYRGGSAKFIAESLRCASRTPHFYLCDTFTGRPRIDPEIDTTHRDRLKFQDTSLQSVTEYLANYTNVEFVVGDIFETSRLLPQGPYGFVHIDVDVLPATDFCLRFFAPRLSRGAAIIVDDYGVATCPGVKKAVDNFIADSPDFKLFHLLTGQALLFQT